MKKLILSLFVFLSAAAASAHTLQSVKNVSNAAQAEFLKTAEGIHAENDKFTAVASYKIKAIQPAAKAGESVEDVYIRVLKFALHRDYPITGDDGGYSFSSLDANSSTQDIAKQLGDWVDTESDAGKNLVPSIQQSLQQGLLVLVGGGSGNNTSADIVAVVNTKTQEMVYLVFSNFGSDD